MKTISFYSYLGGDAHSNFIVTFVNELSRKGKRVVVMDLNFVAPDLAFRFSEEYPESLETPAAHGMLEYFLFYQDSNYKQIPCIVSHGKLLNPNTSNGKVYLFPLENLCESKGVHYAVLNQFDLKGLFKTGHKLLGEPNGTWLIRTIAAEIKSAFNPDYFVVAHQSGVTESLLHIIPNISDVCVVTSQAYRNPSRAEVHILSAMQECLPNVKTTEIFIRPETTLNAMPECDVLLERLQKIEEEEARLKESKETEPEEEDYD